MGYAYTQKRTGHRQWQLISVNFLRHISTERIIQVILWSEIPQLNFGVFCSEKPDEISGFQQIFGISWDKIQQKKKGCRLGRLAAQPLHVEHIKHETVPRVRLHHHPCSKHQAMKCTLLKWQYVCCVSKQSSLFPHQSWKDCLQQAVTEPKLWPTPTHVHISCLYLPPPPYPGVYSDKQHSNLLWVIFTG